MTIRPTRCLGIICVCLLALALIGVDRTEGAAVELHSVNSSVDQDGMMRPIVSMPSPTVRQSGDISVDRAPARDSARRRADPSASPGVSPAGSAISTPAANFEGDDHSANEGTQSTYFLARAVSLASFAVLVSIGLLAARQRRARHERDPEE